MQRRHAMRPLALFLRRLSTEEKGGRYLKIGSVRSLVREPSRPELVPASRASLEASGDLTAHLKWLLQKRVLNQDVFLIGPPGNLRSHIVLQFLELTNEEYEWLSITRDSTEADIKQRREIRSGNASYSDLSAVRAAVEGRVLVIDGVEKAERNVLPILNNLLENREMQLDDGRFLMHHAKFDRLSQKYSSDELHEMGLERVSEYFRVICLGLPVPRFPGYPLDPPLRSRFQCRSITDLPFSTTLSACRSAAPRVSADEVEKLVSLAYAVSTLDQMPFPYVPLGNLARICGIWNVIPSLDTHCAFLLLYPCHAALSEGEQRRIDEFFKKFSVIPSTSRSHTSKMKATEDGERNGLASFVSTPTHERALAKLKASLQLGDVFLLGSKGSGKSSVAREAARLLQARPYLHILYQDMNSRELLQSRRMGPDGDTLWVDSPLVEAARSGGLCILDGVDRLHHSALSALAPLLHHRCIHLPDGTRLVGSREWEETRQKTGLIAEELNMRGVSEISPSFRVLLLADSLSASSSSSSSGSLSSSRWLSSSILSLAPFVHLENLSESEASSLLSSLVPEAHRKSILAMTSFAHQLRNSHDPALVGVTPSLSLRRLVRIARRDADQPGQLRSLLENAVLVRFAPQVTRRAFEAALEQASITDSAPVSGSDIGKELKLLSATEKKNVVEEAMIPETLFYDNELHTRVMSEMVRDFRLGQHLLLIGNQGVGKNKITDRFLQLIQRPRQYMQLHRDTTVESLTLRRRVEGGRVLTEDSALVAAARAGHVLVVDEADKASLHVIAILKSLLDSGTLQLGDGRQIVPSSEFVEGDERLIPLHPSFRLILLANRPGFPFLGNDLFGSIGDLCAVHVIDNPDKHSEIQMLTQYAPDVSLDTLDKLVDAFGELRSMSDKGILQYPYSTREIVNVVRHLQEFPSDSLTTVVRNVFDFDSYSADRLEIVEDVFRRHGIPLGITRKEASVRVAETLELPKLLPIGQWSLEGQPRLLQPTSAALSTEWLSGVPSLEEELKMSSSRMDVFTEETNSWSLPLSETQLACDVALLGDSLLAAAVNPPALFFIKNIHSDSKVEVFDLFREIRGGSRVETVIRLAPLSSRSALVYEESRGQMFVFDAMTRQIGRLSQRSKGIMDTVAMMTQPLFGDAESRRLLVSPSSLPPSLLQVGGTQLHVLDSSSSSSLFTLPAPVDHAIALSLHKYLIKWQESQSWSLLEMKGGHWNLSDLSSSPAMAAASPLRAFPLASSESKSVILDSPAFYFLRGDNFPPGGSPSEITGSRRLTDEGYVDKTRPYWAAKTEHSPFLRDTALLADDILVRCLPRWRTPLKAVGEYQSVFQVGAFLEVLSLSGGTRSYIPVPEPSRPSHAVQWMAKFAPTQRTLIPMGDDKVLTLDVSGCLRSYEVQREALRNSFSQWKNMLEGTDLAADRIEYEKDEFDLSKLDTPKIGKFDPKNTPHVGGNTWAGGTGGYNTAGLGGVGGPFRLDAGHDVHQLSDAAKQQVPEHILQKAREIAKAEYSKRLQEIKMSEYDAEAYDSIWRRVERQTKNVEELVEGLEAKKKERVWLRHQTTGDLDDAKLIDGVAGEHNIYRRRQEMAPDPGTPQVKPKHIRVCMDVSGSMYRFNGYDKRLQRSLEAALLLMTALDGKQDKVKYELTGHSGDGPYIPFVIKENYPKNNKERLDILRQMIAHTQFCASGDFTLEALADARAEMSKDSDSDESIVILISDANLERYGIRPKDLAKILDKEDGVKAFIVMIGSLGDQAQKLALKEHMKLKTALPAGKAFVCKDTEELPKIMQHVFQATLQ